MIDHSDKIKYRLAVFVRGGNPPMILKNCPNLCHPMRLNHWAGIRKEDKEGRKDAETRYKSNPVRGTKSPGRKRKGREMSVRGAADRVQESPRSGT